MLKTVIYLAIFSSLAFAQMSCQELFDSVDAAFDKADSVVMEVWLEQSIFEIGYTKLQLIKEHNIWQSEVLEKRGAQHQKDESKSAKPKLEFDCSSPDIKIKIEKTDDSWLLEAIESDKSKKINHWIVEFHYYQGILLPTKVIAKFEISILTIPISGQAVTKLSDWHFR